MRRLPSPLVALDDACCGGDAAHPNKEGCCASGRCAVWTVVALLLFAILFISGGRCYYVNGCSIEGFILWVWVGALALVAFSTTLLCIANTSCFRCFVNACCKDRQFEAGLHPSPPDSIAVGPNGLPIIAMERIGREIDVEALAGQGAVVQPAVAAVVVPDTEAKSSFTLE